MRSSVSDTFSASSKIDFLLVICRGDSVSENGRVNPHAYAWRLRVDTEPPCVSMRVDSKRSPTSKSPGQLTSAGLCEPPIFLRRPTSAMLHTFARHHYILVVEPVVEPLLPLPLRLFSPSLKIIPPFGNSAVGLPEMVLPIRSIVDPSTDCTPVVILLLIWQSIRLIVVPASNALTPTPSKEKSEFWTVQKLLALPCNPGCVFQTCTLSS